MPVSEFEAEGKLKTVFEDIRSTLGIPTVGRLFLLLGNQPWYLQLAWRNLKPNVSIRYFEKSVETIKRQVLESARSLPSTFSNLAGDEQVRARLDITLDIQSKLLIACGALRAGANGQLPKMHLVVGEDKQHVAFRLPNDDGVWQQPVPNGLPAELTAVDNIPSLTEPLRSSLDASNKLVPEEVLVDLRQRVNLMAEALPFRLEISSSAARQSGLSEDDIDAVRALLNDQWNELPRQILTVARAAASAGIRTRTRDHNETAGAALTSA